MKPPPVPLSLHDRRFRWAAVGGVLFLGVLLAVPGLGRFVFSDWPAPFRQLTGLPCPFCGMTRSGLSMLAGDLSRAFYYNPLGPVLAAAGLAVTLTFAVELVRGTHFPGARKISRTVQGHLRLGLFLLLLFWFFHLGLALWLPKPELLNPEGLLIRWLGLSQ